MGSIFTFTPRQNFWLPLIVYTQKRYEYHINQSKNPTTKRPAT